MMKLINLSGGPGSGKSTSAAIVFSELKLAGYRVELVGEAAKEIAYDGTHALFENQILLTGMQYQRIHRLSRSGCEIAISDSPLIQGVMYAEELAYYPELVNLIRKVEAQFQTYNVFIKRIKPFDNFGRMQKDEAEAKQFDPKARKLIGNFWMEVDGNREGALKIVEAIKAL
jgi:hypothetical protein